MNMQSEILTWKKKLNQEWIKAKIEDSTVEWAKEFGEYLADGIKRSPDKKPIKAFNKDGKPKMKNGKHLDEEQASLSTTQIRKFFGEIRKIQAKAQLSKDFDKSNLILLNPTLAYQVGREQDRLGKIKDFYSQLSIGIDAVTDKSSFNRFVQIVEAIVAYHKASEKENKETTNN